MGEAAILLRRNAANDLSTLIFTKLEEGESPQTVLSGRMLKKEDRFMGGSEPPGIVHKRSYLRKGLATYLSLAAPSAAEHLGMPSEAPTAAELSEAPAAAEPATPANRMTEKSALHSEVLPRMSHLSEHARLDSIKSGVSDPTMFRNHAYPIKNMSTIVVFQISYCPMCCVWFVSVPPEVGSVRVWLYTVHTLHTPPVRSFLQTWPRKKWQGSSSATTVARTGLVLLVTIHLALVPFLLVTTVASKRF